MLLVNMKKTAPYLQVEQKKILTIQQDKWVNETWKKTASMGWDRRKNYV